MTAVPREPVDERPVMLVLAGRDPTGGAGVDADREAIEAAGATARTIVTTETVQDGRRVFELRPRDAGEWSAEARAVLADDDVRVVKTGLLANAAHVRAAAALARETAVPWVVDPVLAASGGEPFLDEAGVRALLEELLPTGPVLTPNLDEAEVLLATSNGGGTEPESGATEAARRVAAAEVLIAAGAGAVLLKGGHGGEDPVMDLVLARGTPAAWISHPRLVGRSLHGSGCRYASTAAAALARGESLEDAARAAASYVARLLAGSDDLPGSSVCVRRSGW